MGCKIFGFENPTVTGDKFLAMTDNTLHHIPAGMFSLLEDAPPHSSRHGHAFLDRDGPDHWIEEEAQFLGPLILQILLPLILSFRGL